MTDLKNVRSVYNAKGELKSATIGGNLVRYVYDGLHRRVQRITGAGTMEFYYGNLSNPWQAIHMRMQSGDLFTLYYDEAGGLFCMKSDKTKIYVVTDHLGSPRVVANDLGQVIKILDYDSWGNVVSDSNPGVYIPIGFGGGVVDPLTGLVNLGMRDYDPSAGRWTARDPILFKGGQANLYVYVYNNPVNFRDPLGTWCVGGSAYQGFGGGLRLCQKGDDWSLCGEVGLGKGANVIADPLSDIEDPGTEVDVNLELGCGPAGFKLDYGLDTCGYAGGGIKGRLGPLSLGEDSKSGGLDAALNLGDLIKDPKCAFQGKVKADHCVNF